MTGAGYGSGLQLHTREPKCFAALRDHLSAKSMLSVQEALANFLCQLYMTNVALIGGL